MSSELVLIARTPNGDGAFVRRADGTVWLLDPYNSRLSSEDEAQQAVRDLDFVPVGSQHTDWTEIDRVLAEAAAAWRRDRSWPGVESYSVATIAEILDDAEDTGGDHRTLARTLLEGCPAAKEEAVYHRLLALLHRPVATAISIRTTGNPEALARVTLRLAA